MSLLSLETARFVAAKNKALPHAVVENEKPNHIALREAIVILKIQRRGKNG
jgi:hypothetical protein